MVRSPEELEELAAFLSATDAELFEAPRAGRREKGAARSFNTACKVVSRYSSVALFSTRLLNFECTRLMGPRPRVAIFQSVKKDTFFNSSKLKLKNCVFKHFSCFSLVRILCMHRVGARGLEVMDEKQQYSASPPRKVNEEDEFLVLE